MKSIAPASSSTPSALRSLSRAAVVTTLFALSVLVQAQTPDFGPNVFVFDPSTPTAQITTTLSNAYFQGLGPNDDPTQNQFSTNRYAILFKPGTYNLQAPVGYYVSIAGLGQTPGSVVINGFLTPNFGSTFPGANVTDTFWRSMENMTFNPTQNTAQDAAPNTIQWGVSQAAPLRRVQINGSLELTDSFCGFASGGFIADSVITGNVNPCSQQQWYTRNSNLGSWSGGVWNMVFSGVTGAPPQGFPSTPITTLATTPVNREKPFLYIDDNGKYNVFVPAVRRDSTDISWSSGMGPGYSKPIKDFFIAKATNTAAEINLALVQGKSLILTPGIYKLNQPINVLYPNTIVLGLGYATLVPQKGNAALTVADVDGVQVAGLIFDAGSINSPVLLQAGPSRQGLVGALLNFLFPGHASNPMSINDVFFRVGGATPGTATVSLEVNSNDVILDNVWCWRADHGNGVGWTANTAAHGLVVNGDNVTALGLFVEHYQQDQVVWNGSGGETIFYQSELPYDPPSQAAWMDGDANGYPSYHVTSKAKSHTAYGLGVYSFFNQGVNIVDDNAIIVPETSNISVNDALTVFLTGSGSITHVIDNTGNSVSSSNGGPSKVTAFP
jgi:putative cofactor-binding repeat protein